MRLHSNEQGDLNVLLIPVILLSLLFVGAGAFAIWAFSSRQDYKTNSDQKATNAVEANKKVVQAEDAKLYAEAAKQPLKTFTGPETYGTLQLTYPKTWSAYILSGTDSSIPLNAYFEPNIVPDISAATSTFALRVEIVSQTYSSAVKQYSSQKGVTASAYALPKLPKVVGIRLEGQIMHDKQGSMIILPIRDKTLLMWTESNDYLNDFNNNVLANVTFSP